MAGQEPQRQFTPTDVGNGVWDESVTPSKLGGKGLTSNNNLIYRRYGAWGKRSGSGAAYNSATAGASPSLPIAGTRWYFTFLSAGGFEPTALTVVSAQGKLWSFGDPNTTTPSAPILSLPLTPATPNPVVFTPARLGLPYNGQNDVLIITGATTPGTSFATGTFTFSGAVTAGQVINLYAFNPIGAITVEIANYTVLPTDNASSVAQALVALINQSQATTTGLGVTPFLGYSTALQTGPSAATVAVGALNSGTIGNGLEYTATVTGPGLTVTPLAYTNMTGGGATSSAPVFFDGAAILGLSYQITNAFTGSVNWHNHVWLWGDKNNPYTLFASDINNPQSFGFMITEGGYQIGLGDGDPIIQACIPIGNILYVFKKNVIYAITGYDFQSGEYQFNVQIAIQGFGIPAPDCAAVVSNAIVFWDGSRFCRLGVGSFQVEIIGRTIPLTSGAVAKGNASLMRVVGGSFLEQTDFNSMYASPGSGGQKTLSNVVLFACDSGSGVADTVLVYDDDASAFIGNYAWSRWTGWTVGAWIPFANGENASASGDDPPTLFWVPAPTSAAAPFSINEYGASASFDDFNRPQPLAIPWSIATGWDSLGTPALVKELHRVFIDLEISPVPQFPSGTTLFVLSLIASGPVNGTALTVYPQRQIPVAAYAGTTNLEANQTLIAPVNPFLRGYKFLYQLQESGASGSTFEVASFTTDAIGDPFTP